MIQESNMNLPDTVCVIGKGPSLDNVDWATMPDFRIGVNEAALVVPDCTVCIALDRRVLDVVVPLVSDDLQFWLAPRTYEHYPVKERAFKFEWGKHTFAADETLACAIRICAYFGVKKIHFVGCDSMSYTKEDHKKEGRPYADCIEHECGVRDNYRYATIVPKIWRAINKTKIVPVWEHDPQCKEVQHAGRTSSSKVG